MRKLFFALRHAVYNLFHPRVARSVRQQVAEDTCVAHNVFCCETCFNMEPAE